MEPKILNRAEVARALEDLYPPLLRDAGIGGAVEVWVFIDVVGSVVESQVRSSSGHEALDRAALNVADIIEFSPALNGEVEVPVWISIPVAFNSTAPASEPETGQTVERGGDPVNPVRGEDESDFDQPLPSERNTAAPSDSPTFTPYTVQPDIKNRAEVAAALERNYPPLLRDAGIGGTAHVWFLIDKGGLVQRVIINESSGHGALDDAALKVASTIEFTPALNRDDPVPVWISLPITFTTR